MKSVLTLGAVALIAATSALAVPNLIREGNYHGSGEGGDLSLSLTHVENDVYKISIDTVVPMENERPGCGGGIDGEVILTPKGGNFFVENEFFDPESPMFRHRHCKISLEFDDEGFLNIEEQEGCLSFHGAACGFKGQLVHESAAG